MIPYHPCMTATSTGPWFEIQALTLCPAQPCPETCSVPPEGVWLPIYHFATEREMQAGYNYVMESDDQIYERYEDFRMAVPSEAAVRRQAKTRKLRVA